MCVWTHACGGVNAIGYAHGGQRRTCMPYFLETLSPTGLGVHHSWLGWWSAWLSNPPASVFPSTGVISVPSCTSSGPKERFPMLAGNAFYILVKFGLGTSHCRPFRSKVVEGGFDSQGSTRKSGQGWLLALSNFGWALWIPLGTESPQTLFLPGPGFTQKQEPSGPLTNNKLSNWL